MQRSATYFFPLSEPLPIDVCGTPAGVFARRIPDFICTCLNDDGSEHASLLEIRAADSDGVPTGEWAHFEEMPDPIDLFEFLPDPSATRIVCGTIRAPHTIAEDIEDLDSAPPRFLELTLQIIERSQNETESMIVDSELQVDAMEWRIDLKNFGESCVGLVRHLARSLDLDPPRSNWSRLVSPNTPAFCAFLSGLDGSAQLDPELVVPKTPSALLTPFNKALQLDPDFGLALRRLHVALHDGVDSLIISPDDALELLDEAYSAFPSDSEAASRLGEHLAQLGEEERAEDWLRLSINQPNPPAQALETLGILLANRGQYDQARKLWRTGMRIDGSPDFFAHLARLDFREDKPEEGWEKYYRGLRRIAERSMHPGEWGEDEGRGGVLLRYLSEHLQDPFDDALVTEYGIDDLLSNLRAQIREPEDRLDLGLCLLELGDHDGGIETILAALAHIEDPDRRDLGAERVARVRFPDFAARLAAPESSGISGDELEEARAYYERVTTEIPQLWPAWYLRGRLEETAKDWERARAAFRQAASLRRDQPKILSHLAIAAAQLQDFDEAIDAISDALAITPTDAALHADHALLLHHAGRDRESREALDIAETLGAEEDILKRVRRITQPTDGAPDSTPTDGEQ